MPRGRVEAGNVKREAGIEIILDREALRFTFHVYFSLTNFKEN
jgi:hypothetical protein